MKVDLSLHRYNIPLKYRIIDNCVSRSAQPDVPAFRWLRDEKNVTDIVDFRTHFDQMDNFNEKKVVEALGMEYHHIPSITRKPSAENIEKFFETINKIKNKDGKAHIHCFAGVDRTGMYSFLYKMKNHQGTMEENINEWIKCGFHFGYYPNLIGWTTHFFEKYTKIK